MMGTVRAVVVCVAVVIGAWAVHCGCTSVLDGLKCTVIGPRGHGSRQKKIVLR